MSIEDFKAFRNRMKTDEEFREKVNGTKDKEERMKIIKEAGYEYTYSDMVTAMEWVLYPDPEIEASTEIPLRLLPEKGPK